jgi:hypothetical protein
MYLWVFKWKKYIWIHRMNEISTFSYLKMSNSFNDNVNWNELTWYINISLEIWRSLITKKREKRFRFTFKLIKNMNVIHCLTPIKDSAAWVLIDFAVDDVGEVVDEVVDWFPEETNSNSEDSLEAVAATVTGIIVFRNCQKFGQSLMKVSKIRLNFTDFLKSCKKWKMFRKCILPISRFLLTASM